MKYIKQMGIIGAVCFVAEVLYALIPLPIPASVYGLIILFTLLCTKIVKLEQIEDVSDWLLAIMPILFLGPSVGFIESFDSLKGNAIAFILVCAVSSIAVTVVTGLVAQLVIRIKEGRKHE